MSASQNITSYMLKLKNDMITKRGIVDSTASGYINLLVLLNDKKPFKNLSFLKDTSTIMEYLKQYDNHKTKANYLSAIIGALFCHKDSYLYKKPYDFYTQENRIELGEIKKIDPMEMTEREENNWIEWEEVKTIYDKMNENMNKYRSMKKLSGTPAEVKAQYEEILNFMLLSLYYLFEPRRNMDYKDMYVIRSDKKENMLKVRNYIVLEDEEFVFNSYKTSKFHGTQVFPIPEELMKNINLYLKFHPLCQDTKKPVEFKFLLDHKGEGFDMDNSITRALYKVFGNRKISSSILRHSYNTHTLGGVIAEMETQARKMGHTAEMGRKYVKKSKVKGATTPTSEVSETSSTSSKDE